MRITLTKFQPIPKKNWNIFKLLAKVFKNQKTIILPALRADEAVTLLLCLTWTVGAEVLLLCRPLLAAAAGDAELAAAPRPDLQPDLEAGDDAAATSLASFSFF